MRLACLLLVLLVFPATAAAGGFPQIAPLPDQRLLVSWQDTTDWATDKGTVNWRVGGWATLPPRAFSGSGLEGRLISAHGRDGGVLILGHSVMTGFDKYGTYFGLQRATAVDLDAAGRPGPEKTLAFDAKGRLGFVISGSDASGLTVAWVDADASTRFRTRTANGWQPARPLGPKFFRATRVARLSGRLIVAGLVGRPGTDAAAALKVGPRFVRLGKAVGVDLAVGPKGIVVVRQSGDRGTVVCLGLDGTVRGRYRFSGLLSDIAIDRSGRAILAHSDSSNVDDPNLYLKRLDRHCRLTGTQELTSAPTHPDEPVQVTGPIQLELGASGAAVAMWPTRRDLRVAFGSTTAPFGPSMLVGSRVKDPSLALEESGRAIIGWTTERPEEARMQWWSASGPVGPPVALDGPA